MLGPDRRSAVEGPRTIRINNTYANGHITATIGYTPQEVQELVVSIVRQESISEKKIVELGRRLQVNHEAVLGFLRILNEKDVPIEKLPATLAEIAERHRTTLKRLISLASNEPLVKSLIVEARDAFEVGEYQHADDLLGEAERKELAASLSASDLADEAKKAANRRRVKAAETRAERGALELARLDYLKAGQHLQAAAQLLPPEEVELKAANYYDYGVALFRYGDERGDNDVLRRAIEVYHRALNELPRDRVPLLWGYLQYGLGEALSKLGERQTDSMPLDQALTAYRLALQEVTRERNPRAWVVVQTSIADALAKLGQRRSDTALLQEAADVYRAALQEWSPEPNSDGWARVQINLGYTLHLLGQRDPHAEQYDEQAGKCFLAALEMLSAEKTPLEWASAHNGMGNVILEASQRLGDARGAHYAVAGFREALKGVKRERSPMYWATIQSNLGNAMVLQGMLEGNVRVIMEAVNAFRSALLEQTYESTPLDWAGAKNNLGNALRVLGMKSDDMGLLREAVDCYREALKVQTQKVMPLNWAMIQNNVGATLYVLGSHDENREALRESVLAHRAALEVYTLERLPEKWVSTQRALGDALLALGLLETGISNLEEAANAYSAILQQHSKENSDLELAEIQLHRAHALVTIDMREGSLKRTNDARSAVRQALDIFNGAGVVDYDELCQEIQRTLDMLVADHKNK